MACDLNALPTHSGLKAKPQVQQQHSAWQQELNDFDRRDATAKGPEISNPTIKMQRRWRGNSHSGSVKCHAVENQAVHARPATLYRRQPSKSPFGREGKSARTQRACWACFSSFSVLWAARSASSRLSRGEEEAVGGSAVLVKSGFYRAKTATQYDEQRMENSFSPYFAVIQTPTATAEK